MEFWQLVPWFFYLLFQSSKILVFFFENKDFVPFDTDEMAHDFVGIYQYEGIGLSTMFDIVKKQIKDYGNDMFQKKNNHYH